MVFMKDWQVNHLLLGVAFLLIVALIFIPIYNHGYAEGFAEAKTQTENNYDDGYSNGYLDGYERGLADAAPSQYDYSEIYNAGYDKGHEDGFESGYDHGYGDGEDGASYDPSSGGPIYVICKDDTVFHKLGCPEYPQMAERYWTDEREILISNGYAPCEYCSP